MSDAEHGAAARTGSIRLVLVAACALVDADGRVLIAQRPAGRSMAGLWEFPGGKIERASAGGHAHPRTQRRAWDHRQRAMPGAAHIRKPRLSGLSPVDAAVRLPALGRNAHRARRSDAEMGEAEPTQGISDAAGRPAADLASDDAAVGERDNRSPSCLLPRWLFVHAERIGEPHAGRARPQRLLLARMRCPARKPDDVKGRAQPAIRIRKIRR